MKQAALIIKHLTIFLVPTTTEGPPGSLRANIAETLLVPLIKVQGGKENQHEEYEGILCGPARRTW